MRFSVLTLNAWMLHDFPIRLFYAKDVVERARLIPRAIARSGADIVGLQEVFGYRMRDELIRAFREQGYVYAACAEPRSVFPVPTGSGLLVVSKFPLSESVGFSRFAELTRPSEAFNHKGVMHVGVEVPGFGQVDLYTTHFGAVDWDPAKGGFVPEQEQRKLAQTRQLLAFARTTQKSELALIIGDLNTYPGSEGYRLFTHSPQGPVLVDAFVCAQGREPRADEYTYNNQNPYVGKGEPSQFLDYIFVTPHARVRPVECEVVFKEPLALSDHYGVRATFEISG